MRKIVVSEFISLDGVIETPEQWHFPYVSDDMNDYVTAEIQKSGAALMGRVTYDIFASFWPTQTNNEFGIAAKLNSQPKYVVSTTLDKAEWQNTTIIKQNVAIEVAKLKQQPGDDIISITGSATLIQSLMQANLIDEFRLLVHPIVVGHGKRLFPDGMATTPLKLVDTVTFKGGAVLLIFHPADPR